ncbi:MAG: Mur ligase family protein, partial [Opitutales bacterium]
RALDHPERDFPVIHVAGTNGKGSFCAMLEAVLRRSGLKVGMLTSPHLVRLGERIQINRVETPDQQIVRLVGELKPLAEQLAATDPEDQPSFFELITAMGFLIFSREKVDVAVVETGLGGRLDATNVVHPILSVITSVGLDHLEQLGSDLTSIAKEKAGIVKQDVPVILGRMPEAAKEMIHRVAEERQAEVFEVESLFSRAPLDLPVTSLDGTFQRWNAATAVVATQVLGERFGLDETLAREALLEVEWAGRWQRMQVGGRHLILDATHNEEGARALDENLANLIGQSSVKPWVVVGVLGEERAIPLMKTVAKWARGIALLMPGQPRACPFEVLEKALPANFSGVVWRKRLEELLPGDGQVALGEPGDIVLVTGSIYLVGEVLARIRGEASSRGLNALQDWI